LRLRFFAALACFAASASASALAAAAPSGVHGALRTLLDPAGACTSGCISLHDTYIRIFCKSCSKRALFIASCNQGLRITKSHTNQRSNSSALARKQGETVACASNLQESQDVLHPDGYTTNIQLLCCDVATQGSTQQNAHQGLPYCQSSGSFSLQQCNSSSTPAAQVSHTTRYNRQTPQGKDHVNAAKTSLSTTTANNNQPALSCMHYVTRWYSHPYLSTGLSTQSIVMLRQGEPQKLSFSLRRL
jgi:hypothetical protein